MERLLINGILIFAVIMAVGCSNNQVFSIIPFKYTSIHHQTNRDFRFEINASLEETLEIASTYVRKRHGIITYRDDSEVYPYPTQPDDNCSLARIEIAQEEFKTYQENSFTKFSTLDRFGILRKHGFDEDCSTIVMKLTSSAKLITALIPRDKLSINLSQPNSVVLTNGVNTIFGTAGVNNTQISNDIQSQMDVYAREVDDDQTELVVIFSPVSNGIVACPNGCSIGHLWWDKVTGREEANMVMDFKYFLEDSVPSSI